MKFRYRFICDYWQIDRFFVLVCEHVIYTTYHYILLYFISYIILTLCLYYILYIVCLYIYLIACPSVRILPLEECDVVFCRSEYRTGQQQLKRQHSYSVLWLFIESNTRCKHRTLIHWITYHYFCACYFASLTIASCPFHFAWNGAELPQSTPSTGNILHLSPFPA